MKRTRKRPASADPLKRPCPTCGAAEQQPCDTRGNNDKPLIARASRLVHADRLEGATNA